VADAFLGLVPIRGLKFPPAILELGRVVLGNSPAGEPVPLPFPLAKGFFPKQPADPGQDEKDYATKVLKMSDAAKIVRAGLTEFALERALFDTIAQGLSPIGMNDPKGSSMLATRIIQAMQKKVLQQKRQRISIRVTEGQKKRGRPKKGTNPAGYGARRRAGAGSKS